MNELISTLRESRLRAYEASPGDIREHTGIEQVVLAGGYGYRQVLELVQNGADAILEAHESGLRSASLEQPRIEILLTESHLYAANTGAPFGSEGIEALLSSHSSPKRGNQIGRFGLGFKSLLRLGGRIDITSGPFSFGFDPQRCRNELKKRFGTPDAPGLRLAWDLEPAKADYLKDRFPWATTVISAEITSDDFLSSLQDELEEFPAEFLIFLPVSVNLTLHMGTGSRIRRDLRREKSGEEVVIHDGPVTSRWRVTEKIVRVDDERAREDATHVHERSAVPVAWAMPVAGKREESGRFWAFLPTQTPSYLPGILNAPWKLNSDRNAIISGEWNTALMQEAARLVADTLPHFSTVEDPARPLDAFPRRMDRSDEEARPLVEALWNHLARTPIIPDANGQLRLARELWMHGTVHAAIARDWVSMADNEQRGKFVHASCLENKRASRLQTLAERLLSPGDSEARHPNLRKPEASQWFGAIASTNPEQALKVLKLAETYEKGFQKIMWEKVRPTLKVIPSGDGRLLTPDEAVFAPDATVVPGGRFPVARALTEHPEARQILEEVFKVKPLNESIWHEVLRENLPRPHRQRPPISRQWVDFWKLLRSAPMNVQETFAKMNIPRLSVLRRDGSWCRPDEVLFPGLLVHEAEDPQSNQQVLIDEAEHATDRRILEIIGVTQMPEGLLGPGKFDEVVSKTPLLSDWLAHVRDEYAGQLQYDQNPHAEYLMPLSMAMPAGWMLLARLGGHASARLTLKLIEVLGKPGVESRIPFGHKTRQDFYPRTEVSHPLLWYLMRRGTWAIANRVVKLSTLIARMDCEALNHLPDWKKHRQSLQKLSSAEPHEHPSEADLHNFWSAMFNLLATPENIKNDSIPELWSGASRDGFVPDSLKTQHGEAAVSEVYVTGSQDLAHHARKNGQTVVTLDEESLELWKTKGARDLAELIRPDWAESIGPVAPLISVIPELHPFMRIEIREKALCRPVADLRIMVENHGSNLPCLMWENLLILDVVRLGFLSRTEKFKRLLGELSAAGWLNTPPANALSLIGNARMEELRAYVASGATLAEKLLRAVGGRTEPLFGLLGPVAEADFIQDCEPEKLSELVLAQLGPVVLRSLRSEMEAEGLRPPSKWRPAEAREFVAAIGFPDEFAGSAEGRREPEEFISGPIHLPDLHDFQEEVLDGIKAIVSEGMSRRRAVVSLPTGGGKTRVTVEAAIKLVLKPDGPRRLVLWIAQTDELCEQAVQAFRQVWLNVGATDTDLRIIRLWGGNPNPSMQDPGKPVVVVSSIQTLNVRMANPDLSWLQKPGLCIVDECHHAITPSYTSLLKFLDAEAPRPGSTPTDEPPLLGLSASPFRTDDSESLRLARRFDSRWLPSNQAELHAKLHQQGVLAHVISEELESGTSLTEAEQQKLASIPEPWDSFELENALESINQRLGGVPERNEALVQRIREASEKSILVFTNSVDHASELAARLNHCGIPAAAVSGKTPAAARRYFLDRFKGGEIRVLCNHSVLSTGFDAPKTDMVLISRTVFSPVRYMQMVGRGLRGVKNGGKPRCRIVTVMDNLGRFKRQHAYHYCQKYFNETLGHSYRHIPQQISEESQQARNPETVTPSPPTGGIDSTEIIAAQSRPPEDRNVPPVAEQELQPASRHIEIQPEKKNRHSIFGIFFRRKSDRR